MIYGDPDGKTGPQTVDTYVYRQAFYKGSRVDLIGSSTCPAGMTPVMLLNGSLFCLTVSGKYAVHRLASHQYILDMGKPREAVVQLTKLGRFREAFAVL